MKKPTIQKVLDAKRKARARLTKKYAEIRFELEEHTQRKADATYKAQLETLTWAYTYILDALEFDIIIFEQLRDETE